MPNSKRAEFEGVDGMSQLENDKDSLARLAREIAEKICNYADECGRGYWGAAGIAGFIEAGLAAALQDQQAQLDQVNTELAKWLSPGNENAKRGYTIAMIRDLAQAKISALGNCEQLEAQVLALTTALEQESKRRLTWCPEHGLGCED